MTSNLIQKLRSGLKLSLLTSGAFGLAGVVAVVGGALIGRVGLSLEDLIGLPAWFAAIGFVVGVLLSGALAMGVRDGRLPRWKAALLGFVTGPLLAAALFLSEGQALDARMLQASLVLGAVVAMVGVLLSGVSQAADTDSAGDRTLEIESPNPLDGPVTSSSKSTSETVSYEN